MKRTVESLKWCLSMAAAIGVACPGATVAASGSSPKKEITREAYELWKSIQVPVLSEDGRWVAYTLSSGDRRAELVVRSTAGATEFRVSRGHPQAPDSPEAAGTERANPAGTWATQFTTDSRFVLFTIAPEATAAGAGAPALGILSLPSGAVTRLPGVSSFTLPAKSGRYVAYERDGATDGANSQSRTLVVRTLLTGQEVQIPEVSGFSFDDAGEAVAYTVSSGEASRNGAYVRHLEEGSVMTLLSGAGDYRSLTFDRQGRQLAFLSNRERGEEGQPRYSVYLAPSSRRPAEAVVKATQVTAGLSVAPESGVQFTAQGNALLFDVRPNTSVGATASNTAEPKADFEFHHWQDAGDAERAWRRRPRSGYRSIYHIAAHRWVQLGNERLPFVMLGPDARHAVGVDQGPYLVQWGWGDMALDVSLIDPLSGHARLLRRGLRTGETTFVSSQISRVPVRLSPGGRFLLYFENRRWFSYDLDTETLHDLTGALLPEVHFEVDRYLFGYPIRRPPLPAGIGGWTSGDARVLLYDQYDVWEVDPAGRTPPRCLTGGVGRRDRIIFRLWPHNLGSSFGYNGLERSVDRSEPLLLNAVNRDTGSWGLWQVRPGKGARAEPLLMGEKKVTLLAKTDHPSQYLVTQETFREFPDLWTGTRLDRLTKISDANPQQREYRWGKVQRIEWTSTLGVPLAGLLYTPEEFDRSRRYPMIVEIYGIFSNIQYKHDVPALPIAANIDLATYLSKGYVVFRPDIVSVSPYPGEAALSSVVPGVQSILDRGFVDPGRIGLIGFSEGGFETNYIITRTALFRCAIEGAGFSDSLSGYAGSPGLFEKTQGMHDYSPWENPGVYFANSPVLFADRVKTPLLILHNEKDPRVPLQQGTEFYTALRRNAREVYLFNYRGEGHGLTRYANRVDWDRRMQQFLDHFLKDAARPDWMAYRAPLGEADPGSTASPPTMSSDAAQPRSRPGSFGTQWRTSVGPGGH